MSELKKQSFEVTAAQLVIILIALQDYSRFSNNVLLQKMADALFFDIDAKRRIDEVFFKQSLDAGEFIMGLIAEEGKRHDKSKAN